MPTNQPHPLRKEIIVTVVGGLIVAVITSLVPWLRSFLVDALLWIWGRVVWTWTALVANYSAPGWIFFIIGLFALVGLVSIYSNLRPRSEPAYKKYTENMLYGAKWRWSWNGNKISNLCCFCPACDAELIAIRDFSSMRFICENCSPDQKRPHTLPQGRVIETVPGVNLKYVMNAVKREIWRRIRTGEYLPSVDQK